MGFSNRHVVCLHTDKVTKCCRRVMTTSSPATLTILYIMLFRFHFKDRHTPLTQHAAFERSFLAVGIFRRHESYFIKGLCC